ncbi:MAG: hypothetical protein H0Z37_06840, partial [Firmicutes bacterium]|nr:hypothetical protein [Bacillota bacterium]
MFGFGQNRRHSSSGGQGGAWWSGIVGASLAALGTNVLASRLRGFGREAVRSWFDRLLEDPYSENLWELVSATRRTGAQAIVENSLRAAHGAVIRRPLGSPRRWPGLDGLVFDPAQLSRRPAPHDAPVDMRVTLGPAAPRPLAVDIPILVAGMAYGLALSLPAKVALARGAALAGTAINGGEGPVTPLERQAAGKLILQYHRAPWGKDPESLAQADMIEIHIGQGASTGVGTEVEGARTDAPQRA